MRRTPLVLGAAAAVTGTVVAARRRPSAAGEWPSLAPRTTGVTTEDGVALSVRVHGPEQPAGSVVLAHGYVLSQDLWDQQVEALLAARPDLRVVTYDHRGHGASARGAREHATIAQLARDLRAVLDAEAEGPTVLAGHSMGGMTVMALAEQFPELIGDKVVAVGLVGTSSGGLADVTLGLPPAVSARIRTVLPVGMARAAAWEDAGRRPLPLPFLRFGLFGSRPRPADVRRTVATITACSAHTLADFYPTFLEHDRTAALAALSHVPVVIAHGTRDQLCPLRMARATAAALPHADLHVFPGAGHMLQLERSSEVSELLVGLTAAVPAGRLAAV